MDNITYGNTNSGMSYYNKKEIASELNRADTDNYIVIDPKSDIIIQESPEKIPCNLCQYSAGCSREHQPLLWRKW